ncbi:unnamed protein product, partial [Effrenium voratum]
GSELQKAKEELTRIKIGTTENLSQAGLRASETFPRKGTPALKTLNGPGSLAFWRGELQGARQFLFQIRHQRRCPARAEVIGYKAARSARTPRSFRPKRRSRGRSRRTADGICK